jgi:GPH family glycoside/pentoside/hexuronide:cation symporter
MLTAIYQLQIVGVGTLTATAPYFVSYVLGGDTAQIGTFFLFMMGGAVVSMPLWTAVARQYGKRAAYKLAALSFSVGIASLLFAANESYSLVLLYAQAAIIGIPFGGIMMIPFSMLTDTIQHSFLRSGVAQEGVFTGLWTACEKIGLAFGPLIAGVVLAAAGFVESTGGGAEQTGTVRLAVLGLFGLVPAILVLSSLLLFRFYELNESDLQSASAAACRAHA